MVPIRYGKQQAVRHKGGRAVLAALALGGATLIVAAPAGAAPAAAATYTSPLFPAPRTTAPRTTAPAPAPTRVTTAPAPTTSTTAPVPAPTTGAPTQPSTPPTAPPAPPVTSAPTAPPTGTPTFADEVTRLTNIERAKVGCAALRTEPKLQAAAQLHAQDMVNQNYFSHTSLDGRGPGDRAAAQGYTTWSGENIAQGFPTPAEVVQGWMNSTGHRANILNCQSKSTGVGFDGRNNMWVQMFGFV